MPFWNPSCPSWKSKFCFFWSRCSDLVCESPGVSRSFSRKVNSFLDRMNPTEAQMASYVDVMCEKLWPEPPSSAPPPPRSEEEKTETRERAHSLISARCESRELLHPVGMSCFFVIDSLNMFCFVLDSNYIILKKTDMESVFNLFQNCEENKTLVYVSISALTLFEFFLKKNLLHVVRVFDPVFCSRCSCRSCWGNYFLMNISWMWAQLPFRKWPTPRIDLWSHNDAF